jgi:hypothetical protein
MSNFIKYKKNTIVSNRSLTTYHNRKQKEINAIKNAAECRGNSEIVEV